MARWSLQQKDITFLDKIRDIFLGHGTSRESIELTDIGRHAGFPEAGHWPLVKYNEYRDRLEPMYYGNIGLSEIKKVIEFFQEELNSYIWSLSEGDNPGYSSRTVSRKINTSKVYLDRLQVILNKINSHMGPFDGPVDR